MRGVRGIQGIRGDWQADGVSLNFGGDEGRPEGGWTQGKFVKTKKIPSPRSGRVGIFLGPKFGELDDGKISSIFRILPSFDGS